MNPGIIGAIVGSALASGMRQEQPSPEQTEMAEEFRSFERASVVAALPAFLVAGYLCDLALMSTGQHKLEQLRPYVHAFGCGPTYWGVPAFFLALLVTHLFLVGFAQFWLQERYERYRSYADRKFGWHSAAARRRVMSVCGLLAMAFTGLGLTPFTVFTEDSIRIIGVGYCVRAQHEYKQVRQIRYQPADYVDGSHTPAYYQITFADGSSWTTVDGLRDPLDTDRAVLAYVSHKSGIKILHPKKK
jgi:hypothetical protein